MTGDMGVFLSSIPKVVIIALVASLIECFVILPVHLYGLNRGSPPPLHALLSRAEKICAYYSGRAMNFPVATAGLLVALAASALVPLGQMPFSLADATEVRALHFNIELPHHNDLYSTRAILMDLRDSVESPGVFTDIVVKSGWRHQTFVSEKQPYLGTLELRIAEEFKAVNKADELASRLYERFAAKLPDGTVMGFSLEANKPPSEPPLVLYLYGENDKDLATANSAL